MRACGLDLEAHPELRATDFYTSHEALLLGYEQAFTASIPRPATGTPPRATIWIGDRAASRHAHIEYFRGIRIRSA